MNNVGWSGWTRLFALACVFSIAFGLEGCPSPSIFGGSDQSDDDTVQVPPSVSEPAKAGEVLIIGGATSSKTSSGAAEVFNPKTATFIPTGAMKATRAGIQAVVFTSGPLAHDVLVSNGLSGTGIVNVNDVLKFSAAAPKSSELFAESTGSFQAVVDKTDSRFFYTMTLLKTGSVLIVGGYTATGAISKTGFVFNPTTQTFKPSGSMSAPRALQTATLLPDGSVLIVGGITDTFGDTVGTAELYDPTTNTFTKLAHSLPGALTLGGHTATLIAGCNCANDGNVLIAGGFSGVAFGSQALESSAQNLSLYNPTAQTFTSMGNMVDDRMLHAASLLPNGHVLFTGGIYGQGFVGGVTVRGVYGGVRASAEIFNPTLNTSTCVGGLKNSQCVDSMSHSRAGHSATALASGDILVAGGLGALGTTSGGNGHALASAEVFNVSTRTFTAAGKMNSTHAFHAAALLQ